MRLELNAILLAIVAGARGQRDVDVGSELMARQAPGSPQFECHFNCGNTIAGSRMPEYCENSTWVGLFEECLECALEFDIWESYGDSVSGAAESCGLEAVPSPVVEESGSAPSSTEPAASTSMEPMPTTSAPTVTEAGEPSSTSSLVPTTIPDDAASPFRNPKDALALVVIPLVGGVLLL